MSVESCHAKRVKLFETKMKENDFKPKFNTAAEVLESLLEGRTGEAVSDNFLRWKLWLSWKDVVGPTVAEHCEPVSFNRGTLWIWVENSVWLQQMTFMSRHIKSAIDQKFRRGFVQEIRFTLDRRSVPNKSNENFREDVRKFINKQK